MGNKASKSALLMAASYRAFIVVISSASGSAHAWPTQLMTKSRANETNEMRLMFAPMLELLTGLPPHQDGFSPVAATMTFPDSGLVRVRPMVSEGTTQVTAKGLSSAYLLRGNQVDM